MDLLERYLQAIGKYLPEASRQDTLAELRANLLEQMDARAEELGRPLEDSDVSTLLRAHGKPELVALRYLPQRSLIGPTIYPFYQYTMRKLLPVVLFAYAIANAVPLLVGRGGPGFAAVTGHALLDLVPTLLLFFAVITIGFALVESGHRKNGASAKSMQWDPAKLPQVARAARHPKVKSRAGRIVDLVVHCLWIGMVLEIFRRPFLFVVGEGAPYLHRMMPLSAVWHTFFPVLLVMLGVQLVLKIGALYGEHRWDVTLQWAVKLIGVGLLVLLATASVYFLPDAALGGAQQMAAVNHGLNTAFKLVLAIRVAQLLIEAWKQRQWWFPVGRSAL